MNHGAFLQFGGSGGAPLANPSFTGGITLTGDADGGNLITAHKSNQKPGAMFDFVATDDAGVDTLYRLYGGGDCNVSGSASFKICAPINTEIHPTHEAMLSIQNDTPTANILVKVGGVVELPGRGHDRAFDVVKPSGNWGWYLTEDGTLGWCDSTTIDVDGHPVSQAKLGPESAGVIKLTGAFKTTGAMTVGGTLTLPVGQWCIADSTGNDRFYFVDGNWTQMRGGASGSSTAFKWVNHDNADLAVMSAAGDLSTEGTIKPKVCTVATLPTPGTAGRTCYVTNGRNTGEGAAAGTGVLVADNGTIWRISGVTTAVAA